MRKNGIELVAGSRAVVDARLAHRAAIREALAESVWLNRVESIARDRRFRDLISRLTPSTLADPRRRARVLTMIEVRASVNAMALGGETAGRAFDVTIGPKNRRMVERADSSRLVMLR